jgi:nicotinate dehydrogenase subunit A
MQCGYCSGGIMISAAALLAANPDPDETAIRRALEGHICRCGTHSRIIRAVRRAARKKKEKPV